MDHPCQSQPLKKKRGEARFAASGVEDTHDDAYATRASEKTAERTETNQAGRA